MPSEDHDWSNPAERAQFAKMWMAGETTTVIAAAFRVSVNAVVGIRKRMALPARPSPIGHNPSALTIDFDFVHNLRKDGKSWPEAGAAAKHSAKPLSQWYYSQCAKRGVAPVMTLHPAKRGRRIKQVRDTRIFSDIQKAREARETWASIAARIGFSKNNMHKWYTKECRRRDIKPVVVPQLVRHSEFTFRKEAPVEATPPPDPISGGVLYETMPRGCCNWMLNDARPWRACGAPAGRVYCGEHTRQASARFCTRVVLVGEVAA